MMKIKIELNKNVRILMVWSDGFTVVYVVAVQLPVFNFNF